MTTVEPPLMVTSHWQVFFVVFDSSYIDSYFNSQLLNDRCTQNNTFHPKLDVYCTLLVSVSVGFSFIGIFSYYTPTSP